MLPVEPIVTYSIVFTSLPVVPPAMIPLVELAVAPAADVCVVKSPKSVALPIVAIVI